MKLRKGRLFAIILFLLGILLIGGSVTYMIYTSPMDKKNNEEIEVLIPQGMPTIRIGKLLQTKGLIRNSFFFRVYLKLHGANTIKADIYYLKKSMTMEEIVQSLSQGSNYNPDAFMVTFKEGQTIKDYAKIIEENTNIKATDFLAKMQDRTYIASLMNDYWFLTDAILNENIYYPLEGYLAPETYSFKNKDITIEEIVKIFLDQTNTNLSSSKEILESQANIHEIITLASIAELEGKSLEDRKQIVGVFRNRLALGMNLGSDVTTYYAFQEEMTSDLTTEMFNTYNPYNTRSKEMAGQLPVGPICNPDKSSIQAAIAPTTNDFYYFVADKNGKIYYTKTVQEHNQTVQAIKDKGDWIW